jgi:hypothetical protein
VVVDLGKKIRSGVKMNMCPIQLLLSLQSQVQQNILYLQRLFVSIAPIKDIKLESVWHLFAGGVSNLGRRYKVQIITIHRSVLSIGHQVKEEEAEVVQFNPAALLNRVEEEPMAVEGWLSQQGLFDIVLNHRST